MPFPFVSLPHFHLLTSKSTYSTPIAVAPLAYMQIYLGGHNLGLCQGRNMGSSLLPNSWLQSIHEHKKLVSLRHGEYAQ